MTPERWQLLDDLFTEAAEVPPERIDDWLGERCGDDEEMRRELEAMLAVDRRQGDAIESVVGRAARDAVDGLDGEEDDDGTLPEGFEIHHWRIQKLLGRGGMGAVYLAERTDDFRQHVAIKIVTGGLGNPDLRKRLRTERQILAGLNHPNIAKLLDGGTLSDGTPYLVMEYVDGIPLHTWCERNRVSIPRRLALFRQVCDAVDYAHRNLIVHRDIKPTNILVTSDGVPKLLDFGIAKLLNPDDAGVTVAMTRANVRVLTPEYASPEQIRGAAITTASDVYSLGVLLYQLLTGRQPYRIASMATARVEEVVCHQEPRKPSTVAVLETVAVDGDEHLTVAVRSRPSLALEPTQLRRRLAGDLDNIVMMALHKEPELRYGSAAALSDDIARHLDGLPVTARPATMWYRSSRFVRRHWVGVSLSVLMVAALVSFAVSMALLAERIAEERDIAARERQKAEQVSAFLTDMFTAFDPAEARGRDVTAVEILERGVERADSELGGNPELRASLLVTIADVYESLSMYGEAEAVLREAMRIAPGSLDAEERAWLQLDLADVLERMRRLDEAARAMADAEIAFAETWGRDSEEFGYFLVHRGRFHTERGEMATARQAFADARTILSRTLGPDDFEVGRTLTQEAMTYHRVGRFAEAVTLDEKALEIFRSTEGPDHPETLATIVQLAQAYAYLGDQASAEGLFEEYLDTAPRVLGDEHSAIAGALGTYGKLLQDKGELFRARAPLEKALAMDRQRFGDQSWNTAYGLVMIGHLDHLTRQHDSAETNFRQALDIYEGAPPPNRLHVATARVRLGNLLNDDGRPEQAEIEFRLALEIYAADPDSAAWFTARCNNSLAGSLMAQGRIEEAAALMPGTVDTLMTALGPDSVDTLRAKQYEERLASMLTGRAASLAGADET